MPSGLKLAEWSGALFGLVGAFLLALHNHLSEWGFVLYLLSNVFLIVYALGIRAIGLLVMQLGFFASSVLGVVRWVLPVEMQSGF